ncbi:MocR-like pyridoxine biosynthesis transcription factor PdxR [Paenibacillus pini]|uniref:Transcriptional regulator n=1 Tax=Paenibacillus pini JCM 16418 TaxID=1236976 RepID=W7YEI3_9BACL|nr:PLP-dependent aminotransferase family protein [Paenibacillus pini]GAF06912.1 transcriptional regulator [Paenibacillus pini JCM 16418]
MVQELLIHMDKTLNIPLNRQIYDHIRKVILSGSLQIGEAIPPTRQLSEQLEVSRSVVIQAYEQLQAEGYLIMKQGSGTFVADNTAFYPDDTKEKKYGNYSYKVNPIFNRTAKSDKPSQKDINASPPILYDFKHGLPAWDVIPMDQWQKSLVRVCRRATPELLGYGPPEGSLALRKEIARILRSSRSITVVPEQIVITTGATQALDILARLMVKPGDQVVVEDPAHGILRDILQFAGAEIISVPVDQQGIRVNQIDAAVQKQGNRRCPIKLAYVTPSHQFPMGVTLSMKRRIELLNWADREGSYIIEDDYDSEYRYVGQKISALAGLDMDERIIYVGSFSKVIFPALRIGYAVLPRKLVKSFLSIKNITDRMGPSLEQEALADFIQLGHYAKHINQMGKLYAVKRAGLIRSLERAFGKSVNYFGEEAGLHLLIEIDTEANEESITSRALDYGVRVYPAASYYVREKRDKPMFILGYSNMSEEQMDEGIQYFAQAMNDCANRKLDTISSSSVH